MEYPEEITILRRKLDQLISRKKSLSEKEIVECSQTLDRLIVEYLQGKTRPSHQNPKK
ncbi:MAG: aspartyl-phosphate phosphatase Spo0E family protein [Clostridia bacterium]